MRRRLAAATLLAVALGACAGPDRPAGPDGTTAPPRPSNPRLQTVEVAFGDRVVEAEVADEHRERLLGLMNRERLGTDEGMLFLFEAKTSGGFWMKNTLIPLSIAYLGRRPEGEGRFEVLAIVDMEPCRADPCPNYPPGRPYDAALEVNRGWFDAAGVEAGDLAVVSGAP